MTSKKLAEMSEFEFIVVKDLCNKIINDMYDAKIKIETGEKGIES